MTKLAAKHIDPKIEQRDHHKHYVVNLVHTTRVWNDLDIIQWKCNASDN
jgi:hypothetical protein